MQLQKARFESARGFVHERARPLDRALFSALFENGDAAAVSNALVAFRNEDGGFGNALEPDFRLPASSPMATSMALQQ